MIRRMLDTNTVSYILTGRYPAVDARLRASAPADLCVSAVTFGEIGYGLARRPQATRLAKLARDFFASVAVLPWTETTGQAYGYLRASMQRDGRALTPLDMLIAAHAIETGSTLVTSDRAFFHTPGLKTEDWTTG